MKLNVLIRVFLPQMSHHILQITYDIKIDLIEIQNLHMEHYSKLRILYKNKKITTLGPCQPRV